jgi:hypothetical protein
VSKIFCRDIALYNQTSGRLITNMSPSGSVVGGQKDAGWFANDGVAEG